MPKVDKEIIDALQQYDFPGNVRELKHMVERALILCEGNTMTIEHFDHLKIKLQKPFTDNIPKGSSNTLKSLEKESIENALRNAANNKSQAARMLNISRQALDRKIEKLGIVMAK